ncbi:selenocysteine-specific translation elongation factor [Helicobacter monodelphidis]|uniref:selenocysteine-specific translation elongation factor n=1 Tax=Helicobacter sp. 15-1451 TaxID=2004995 RepID=UPI000DCEE327|nr:selenocysteine-specific translation elongation factor [Helicobacter sp. 15-1451]RAX57007.1 selenocysteine-specific translation elongation factor [Helicobacter sp. 15-1451]
METLIVGVAGHIDHGKTSLIQALNGFDGDSTQVEKERKITIDLSFSNLIIESHTGQKNISFIDVPGHQKWVKNMLAGAFGFDYLLLCVDAKEGVMPQTQEHLEIAAYLGVKNILAVITKSDLASKEQLELCEIGIREYVSAIGLQLKCCIACSIYDYSSLNLLKEHFRDLSPSEYNKGEFRYYVDRSFSLSGIGCVVSGTVLDSSVSVNEDLFCYDLQKHVHVKNIMIHQENVSCAKPSSRAALNLSSVHFQEIKRGFLLAKKGLFRGFKILGVELFCFHQPPLHNSKAFLYIGAKRVNVRILLLDGFKQDPSSPYKKAFAELEAEEDIFALFHEHFVLRNESRTIAGGRILNPIADPMKKKQKYVLLQALSESRFDDAFKELLNAHKCGFGLVSSYQRFRMDHAKALEIAKQIPNAIVDSEELVVYPDLQILYLTQEIKKIIAKNKNALLSSQSLHLRFLWATPHLIQYALTSLLESGDLQQKDGLFLSVLSKIENIAEFVQRRIYEEISQAGFAPIAPYNLYDILEIDRKSGDNALKLLCKERKISRLNAKLFINTQILSDIKKQLREIILKEGYVDIQNAKEYFPLSRKYLISYLEYLDKDDDIIKENQKRFFKEHKD